MRNEKGQFVKGLIPWNKGKSYSKETKEKISKSNKGQIAWNKGMKGLWKCSIETRRKMSEAHKGEKCYWYGKHHSEATKLKVSQNRRGKLAKEKHPFFKKGRYGKKAPNWIDGRTGTKLYKQLCHHKRRLLKEQGGELTLKTIQLVYEDNIKKFGTLTCYLCLKPIEFGKDTLEHKIPLSRGGTNEYYNLAVACGSCNSKKHNKTLEEFLHGKT